MPVHCLTYRTHKITQNSRLAQDQSILDLLKSVRDMAAAASFYDKLQEIPGAVKADVFDIEEIARATLEAARIVHDYVSYHPSHQPKGKAKFWYSRLPMSLSSGLGGPGRIATHALPNMPSRIASCQALCKGLAEKHNHICLDSVKSIQREHLSALFFPVHELDPTLIPPVFRKGSPEVDIVFDGLRYFIDI